MQLVAKPVRGRSGVMPPARPETDQRGRTGSMRRFTEEQWRAIASTIGRGADSHRAVLEQGAFFRRRKRPRNIAPHAMIRLANRAHSAARKLSEVLDQSPQFTRALAELVAKVGETETQAERRVREDLDIIRQSADALYRRAEKELGQSGRPRLTYEDTNVAEALRLWRGPLQQMKAGNRFLSFAEAWINAIPGVSQMTENQIAVALRRIRKGK